MRPYHAILVFLRNRSCVISLHEFTELADLEKPYVTLVGDCEA